MNCIKLSIFFLCVSSIKCYENLNDTLTIESIENNANSTKAIKTEEKVLSRKRRYLIFPHGSSFSVAVCSTIGIYGNPQFSIFR